MLNKMDNQGYGKALNGCLNRTSINIEMCVNTDSNQDLVYRNTLELTKNLMKKFNIDNAHVCRHYDVSRKDCPHNFRANNWTKWWQFKEDLKQPIQIPMDLSKNNVFKTQEGYLEQRIEKVMNNMKDTVKVEINGSLKELRGKNIDGTNYVSIRDFANIMGLQVGWNQEKQTVILRGEK